MSVEQQFSEGQIVALRSGGPGMTSVGSYRVINDGRIVDYLVKCLWFDGDDRLQRGDFLQSQLETSEPGRRRHLHFHPGESQILTAAGDLVLIEPVAVAAERIARQLKVTDIV